MRRSVRTLSLTTVALFLSFSHVHAAECTIPNSFTAGTKAVAAQVNANFNAVKTAVDDNDSRIAALEAAMAALQTENADLRARLEAVEANSVLDLNGILTTGTVNGNPAAILTNVNVHIRNGNAATFTTNGTGNLIIGYNETRGGGQDVRTGSHNLIIGRGNNYSSYGGQVVGYGNTTSGAYSSVSGGYYNIASATGSSVSGGGI